MPQNHSTHLVLSVLKSFIDRTTTYRLMLYYLLVLFVVALVLSVIGAVSYAPTALLWSLAIIVIVAWLTNEVFARIFGAVTNLESALITGLILAFLLQPTQPADILGSLILAAAAAIAMASKYVLAWRRKHLFNPAALAAAVSAFALSAPAVWWVADSSVFLPFVILGGLVLVYKLRRFDLIIIFGVAVLAAIAFLSSDPLARLEATLQYSAVFFFMFAMLTEPSTMPTTRTPRLIYGALIGALFIWAPFIGPIFVSPEVALLIGNLFAFVLNPKGRYTLTLTSRTPLASGIYEYIFTSDRPIRFKPGQYLEWTLAKVPYDNRGNRRYFTIASAPENNHLALGVRFYDKPSAFKRTLAALPLGTRIQAATPSGDFTLPRNKERKLAFLAGGIGITPFVSMARHINEVGEKRDATLLYAAKNEDEVAYKEVFLEATRHGLRTSYIIGGVIDEARLKREIPDFADRLFYISGPPPMIDAMKKLLKSLDVGRRNIKTDFFPGLA